MTKLTFLVAAQLLLGAAPALADGPTRKSPYFIDGLQCEGLAEAVDDDALKRNYPNDEVAQVGVKVLRQTWCENIFKEYGVEKFQWMTLDDLENLSFAIKHSQKYEAVDITLEKSELQNHVYLIGKFKLWPTHTQFDIKARSSIERGNASAGNRNEQELSGAVGFSKRGPANPALITADFDFRNSTAKAPLSQADLMQEGKPVSLTPSEQIAQSRQSGSYDHADVRFQFPTYRHYDMYFLTGIDESQITGDKEAATSLRDELGVVFTPDALAMQTTITPALLYSSNEMTATQVYTGDKNSDPKTQAVVYGGLREKVRTSFIDVDLDAFRAFTSDLHGFMDAKFLLKFAHWGGVTEGVGADVLILRGADLAEYRLGLPDRTEQHLFLSASRDFSAFGADSSAYLKIGSGNYSSELQNEATPYSTGNYYGGLDLVSHGKDLDLSLAFLYGSARLF